MEKSTFNKAVQDAEDIIKAKFDSLQERTNVQVRRTISGVQVTDSDDATNGLNKEKKNARETMAAMQQLRDKLQESQLPCIATLPRNAFTKLSDMLGLYRIHTKSGYVSYKMDGADGIRFKIVPLIFFALLILAAAILEPAFFNPQNRIYAMLWPAKTDIPPETAPYTVFRAFTFVIALTITALLAGVTAITAGVTLWERFLKHAPAKTLLKKLWPDKYLEEGPRRKDTPKIKIAFRSVNKEFQASLIAINKTKGLAYGIAAQPDAIFFPDRKDAVKKWDEALKADPILYVYNKKAVAIVSQSGEFKDEKALLDFTRQIDYLAHLDIISPDQENRTPQ